MADSNKPIVPGGDTVGTVGEVYLSKNGKTYECVAVIDNTTVTPNGETIPKIEYVWVCTDDGAGGGTFPFDVSDAEPITISRTKEELIAAIDAGKTPIGYWLHTQSNGTVIRLFHFVKRFNATDGINLTFYFSDKTSSGVLDIRADGTIKRTYQHNDGGGASGSENFTFTITPTNGPGSQMLSATRAEMLTALDSGKTLLGYWTETKTILETTDTIKHEFRLESVSGAGASRGLAFVNYEQFYKSTLYVNGNDTVSFVDKEVLPAPMTKTEAMTQSVGMDDDGRLWTAPGSGASGGGVQSDWNQNDETAADYVKNRPFYTGDPVETVLVEESTVTFGGGEGDSYRAQVQSTFEATVGETYKVSWDGTVYECTCVSVEDTPAIGNLSIVGAGSDTGEPFLMGIINGQEIEIATADTSATHTFSISGFGAPEVVKIDPKYLPDNDNPLNITGATVGQIAKITAVDDTGKPTSWKTMNISSFAQAPFKPAGKSYLTFSSPSSFTLRVKDSTKHWDGTLEYFASNKTWTTWNGRIPLSSFANGDEYVLYLRGTGNTVITGSNQNYKWVLTGSNIACIGNIENLLDYATVESGEHPTMAIGCYAYMFHSCTGLIQAPELPATTLVNNCYMDMFYGCTSLTQAPELPATTLARWCYMDMFYGCTSLTQAPELPATTLVSSCYGLMFYGCTGLIQAPELPATTLVANCYQYMFQDCTSLTQAPALPAMTLANYCYQGMFLGCTALTQAPALPATTLEPACYQGMFNGCTSLKLSSTQTEEYTQEYRIPSSGEGVTATNALKDMFTSTGGTFTGTPAVNTTYYLSSNNMVVRETEIATLNGYVGSMIDAAIGDAIGGSY